MQYGGVLSSLFAVIMDSRWPWLPCSAMRVHGSRKWLPSRFPTFRSQHGVVCSSFDVARDSNTARSRLSRKHATRLMPISNTVNTWRNTGENGDLSKVKLLLPGALGRVGISFSVSVDP